MEAKKKINRKDRNWLTAVITIAFLIVILAIFGTTAHLMRDAALDDCYRDIEDTAEQAVHILGQNMEGEHGQLELVAKGLSLVEKGDGATQQNLLDYYADERNFDTLVLKLADGTVMVGGSDSPNIKLLPLFESDRARVPYVSGLFGSDTTDETFIYQAVPVSYDDGVTGVLYGFTNIDNMLAWFNLPAYGGRTDFYIIDGDTGDVLVDSRGYNMKNISAPELDKLETKEGYSFAKMRQDVKLGKSGYLVLKSEAQGEWVYTYYCPTGINNWSL